MAMKRIMSMLNEEEPNSTPSDPQDIYQALGLPQGYTSPKTRAPQSDDTDDEEDDGSEDAAPTQTKVTATPKDYSEGYSGPTEDDIRDRREMLNRPLNKWSMFTSMFDKSIKPKDFDKKFITDPAQNNIDDENAIQNSKQRQTDYAQNQMMHDPNHLYSKIAQSQMGQKLAGMADWAQRNNNPDMLKNATDMMRGLSSMSAADIMKMNGAQIEPKTSNDPAADRLARSMAERKLALAEDNAESKDDWRDERNRIARLGMIGRWADKLHTNKDVQTDTALIRATGQALEAFDDPAIKYSPNLHNELNAAVARAVSGRGAVLPVQSEKGMKVPTMREDLTRLYSYMTGAIPKQGIPPDVKENLRATLVRLHNYNIHNRAQRVKMLVPGHDFAAMGGSDALNSILDTYDKPADAYSGPSMGGSGGSQKATPEYIQAVKDELQKNPNHPKKQEWMDWLKQNGG